MTDLTEHTIWMKRAFELAAMGLGYTRPNPMVGCVIVRDGKILGEGFHHQAGMPHAEREALAQCNVSTKGATAYVTLEPCNHTGRTAPCVDGLIEAGISRVVIAQRDPNPVASGGIEKLRANGLEVIEGVMAQDSILLNAEFNTVYLKKRPLVTLKWAMSLDGRTSTVSGDSKWITNPEARKQVHAQRAHHAAVVVGIETLLKDNARLTVRNAKVLLKPPHRIVFDSDLRIPLNHGFLNESSGQAVVVCSKGVSPERLNRFAEKNVLVWQIEKTESGLSIPAFLDRCLKEEITSVYVEGGRRLAGSFLEAKQVDRVFAFMSPKIITGSTSNESPITMMRPIESMENVLELQQVRYEIIDDNVMCDGWVSDHLFTSQ